MSAIPIWLVVHLHLLYFFIILWWWWRQRRRRRRRRGGSGYRMFNATCTTYTIITLCVPFNVKWMCTLSISRRIHFANSLWNTIFSYLSVQVFLSGAFQKKFTWAFPHLLVLSPFLSLSLSQFLNADISSLIYWEFTWSLNTDYTIAFGRTNFSEILANKFISNEIRTWNEPERVGETEVWGEKDEKRQCFIEM